MSNINSSLSYLYHLPFSESPENAPDAGEKARSAQKEIYEKIQPKVSRMGITPNNLISKQGLVGTLGQPTMKSKLKDRLIRRNLPQGGDNDAVGSNFNASVRLADKYQELQLDGTKIREKVDVLVKLKEKLETHNPNSQSREHIGDVIDYVKHEIAGLKHPPVVKDEVAPPIVDVAKDNVDAPPPFELSEECCAAIDRFRDSIGKLRNLSAEGGDENPATRLTLLRDIQKELTTLKDAGVPSNLYETVLPELDKSVLHYSAVVEHQKLLKDHSADGLAKYQRLLKEISQFDKAKLEPQNTLDKSTNSLNHAKLMVVLEAAGDTALTLLNDTQAQRNQPILREPDGRNLTGRLLNDKEFNQVGGNVAKLLTNGDTAGLNQLALKLGAKLAQEIAQQSSDVQLSFACSRGDAFKNDLLHTLAGQGEGAILISALAGNYSKASPELKSFLDTAYKHAVTNLPNRQVDDNNLIVNGTSYQKVKHLAAGSYGTVDLYESADKSSRIAVKTPLVDSDDAQDVAEKFEAAAHEIKAHRFAEGPGHANIVGLLGAIPTADGKLLTTMEFASGGTAHQLMHKLDAAENAGQISSKAANLVRVTIFNDMVQCVKHVQETRGGIHMDLKPGNFFMGTDGLAKMGDFGTMALTPTRTIQGQSPVDNPRWMSPELLQGQENRFEERDRMRKGDEDKLKAAKDALGRLPNLSPEQKASLTEEIALIQARIRDRKADAMNYEVDGKTDTWSLGVTAYELFYHELPFDAKGSFAETKISKAVRDYAADPENRLQTRSPYANGGGKSEGAGALDRVLNAILRGDPKERVSLTALSQFSLFSQPGIGSTEVRDLIKALSSDSTDAAGMRAIADKVDSY